MGGGNMFQANQSFEILAGQFEFMEGKGFYFGILLALLVGAVIIGGIESIGRVTGRIVPIMAAVYLISALIVRSEEHTSELQSRPHLVCRLLLEKKKKKETII